MTSLARITLAGLATLLAVGSAEAMPVATTTAPSAPIVDTAVVVTRVVRRPVVRRIVRPRVVITKKVIR